MVKDEKQRAYFRLSYPQSYRPVLTTNVDRYEVEDVSEYGIRIRVESDIDFMVNDTVMATIVFPDGREFDLSGQVVRVEDGYAGVQLDMPLPRNLIHSEALQVMSTQPQ